MADLPPIRVYIVWPPTHIKLKVEGDNCGENDLNVGHDGVSGLIGLTDSTDQSEWEDVKIFPIPTTAHVEYIDNLFEFDSCSFVANVRYYDKDNERLVIEGYNSNLYDLVKENFWDFFQLQDDRRSLTFTPKMKNILLSLLLGYEYFTKRGMGLLCGDDGRNIIFLKGDEDHEYPRIINCYSDNFEVNNYGMLVSLFNQLRDTLGGNAIYSKIVCNFFTVLTNSGTDFAVAANHPALWREGSSIRFVFEAKIFLMENNINKATAKRAQIDNESFTWRRTIENNNGLPNYLYEEIVARLVEKKIAKTDGKKNNKPYSDDVLGLVKLRRDMFGHYKMDPNILEKELDDLFPTFYYLAYNQMRLLKFEFKENPFLRLSS